MGLTQLLDKPKQEEAISGEFPENNGTDLGRELTPDPEPGAAPKKRRSPAMKAAKPRSAASSRTAVIGELTTELETYAKMMALTIAVRGDEVCSAALSSQAHEIASALAVLIARSDRMLSIVHGGGLLADLTKLGMAAFPVVQAVREHHSGKKETTSDGDSLGAFPAYPGPAQAFTHHGTATPPQPHS